MTLYTRKETSEKTQIPSDTLRYYENLGVIPAPKRADNSYRMYDDDDIVRLLFIKQAKLCGFTLKEVARTMTLVDSPENCDIDSGAIIDAKLAQIDRQIEALDAMKGMLLLYKDKMGDLDSCTLSQYLLEK